LIKEIETREDCISRVRRYLYLTLPLNEDFLAPFKNAELYNLQINDFRSLLPASKVIVTISSRIDGVLIVGAFGLEYLNVTYTKDGEGDRYRNQVEDWINQQP
jgi:hypothetical protein